MELVASSSKDSNLYSEGAWFESWFGAPPSLTAILSPFSFHLGKCQLSFTLLPIHHLLSFSYSVLELEFPIT
jgi:hypothetical protein